MEIYSLLYIYIYERKVEFYKWVGLFYGIFEVNINLLLLALDVHVSPLYLELKIILTNTGRLVYQPSLFLLFYK